MKCHLPFVDDWIAFFFLAKIPWQFTWENRIDLELFGLFVYSWMKRPFSAARAIPKSDRVARTFVKESSKILRNSNGLQLVWMRGWIKNVSCSMNGVSDDNDTFNVGDLYSLIYSTSNREQLCFSGSDIDCMMNCFS